MKECEKIIDLLYYHKESIPEMVSIEKEMIDYSLKETLFLNPGLYDITIRKRAFTDLLLIINECHSLDIKEQWGLFLSMIHVQFSNVDYDEFVVDVRRAYQAIVNRIETMAYSLDNSYYKKSNSDDLGELGPIVIVTSQFLSLGHAPTRRVLDYAFTIITEIGLPAIIINDANTHCNYTWTHFCYEPEYNKYDSSLYKGVDIPLYQARNEMLDIEEMTAMYNVIREMNPRLVLNVGAYSILTDMCRHFTKTASIPCAIDLPISMSEYLLLPRDTRESDREVIESLSDYQIVLNTNYNYVYPDDISMEYNKKMFLIDNSSFVIAVVGNRLDREMDDLFLKSIKRVIETNERVWFLMIGEVSDRDRVIELAGKKDRICFTGKIEEAGQCIKIIDVYVNPKRTGGGRSAFEALYHGKPVVSLKYGDVWGTAGDEFVVDDYNEMVERICNLASDTNYYDKMSKSAKNRADELEDMGTTFSKLFEKLEIK